MIGFTKIDKGASGYPDPLLRLSDCPDFIYLAGEIIPQDELSIAVVGTRKMSSYGRDVCAELVTELSSLGITIVSGLMYGVDLAAHNAALKAGGRTIGVLGFGVDNIDLVHDKSIVEEIVGGGKGAILTEFECDQPPTAWTFPKRDRLIAALAKAVLVIEAAEKSGTNYTVGAALDLGKEVLSVPGSIFSGVSKGTNRMIKDGAKMVCGIEDVLEVLDLDSGRRSVEFKSRSPVSKEEEHLLSALDNEIYVDDLALKATLDVSKVMALLTSLELKGMVKDMGRGFYRKV